MNTIDWFKDKLPSNYEVDVWGDQQLGNNAVHEPAIKKYIHNIRAVKNRYSVHGGDLVETIAPTDKRFSIETHVNPRIRIQDQINWFVELFEPTADKILWMLRGNHEHKFINSFDIVADICDKMGWEVWKEGQVYQCERYGHVVCKADMGTYKIYDWHGKGGFKGSWAGDPDQWETNEQIWLKRKLRRKAADCELMIMHHIHKVIIRKPKPRLEIVHTGNKAHALYPKPVRKDAGGGLYVIDENDRWYASSGTALKSQGDNFSTYAEFEGYEPNELACIRIIVKKDKVTDIQKILL